jgi:hypothetical protein
MANKVEVLREEKHVGHSFQQRGEEMNCFNPNLELPPLPSGRDAKTPRDKSRT